MDCCEMAIFPYDNMNGIGGALTVMEGCTPGAGGTLVYLNVEGDLDAVLARIPPAGGKVIRDRLAIPPHGFIAIFEDTEGNVVGLHSMV
jgi:predicted enzyme related to lactoylglutathione lyase